MHLVYINPNSTQAMTDSVVEVAQKTLPELRVSGLTNHDGPPAIEGAEDGDAAIPGVLQLVAQAQADGADVIVIACFDDTGLSQARAGAGCSVLGIGESAYTIASLSGTRFSVVTSVTESVPVIERNLKNAGFDKYCASVRSSGLAVLEIEKATEDVRARLADAIVSATMKDESTSVVLGCAGMSPLLSDLTARTNIRLIDGVVCSAYLAVAMVGATLKHSLTRI